MEPTGEFITKEELERLIAEQRCSGMWISGGISMGDPGRYVQTLNEKYKHIDWAIDTSDGQFYKPSS